MGAQPIAVMVTMNMIRILNKFSSKLDWLVKEDTFLRAKANQLRLVGRNFRSEEKIRHLTMAYQF
jgi:hypothetical protein